MIKRKKIVSFYFIATIVTQLASSISSAAVIAPYFYTWGINNSSYKVKNLMDSKNKAGLNAVTLAFELSGGGCTLSSDVDDMLSDVKSFMAQGGRVIVSFGGASGTYIHETCSSADDLVIQMENFIKRTGITNFDFDIEGSHLSNTSAISILITSLVQLESKYPHLYVSYTVPVDAQSGLNSGTLNLLTKSQSAGVRVDIVNIMTMDYGYSLPGKNMGDLTIASTEKTVAQLKGVYSGKTNAELYAAIGITPMIGINDDNSVFTLADAQAVTKYAMQNGIGLLSYWAFQRDQVGSGNIDINSGVNTSDFQFYKIMLAAQGSTPMPTATPAPTPKPTPTPTPAPKPTPTPIPKPTSTPTPTPIPKPTSTPTPTPTPIPKPTPTLTPIPTPTLTPIPAPTPTPGKCQLWKSGIHYHKKSVVSYDGVNFTAKHGHTSSARRTPPSSPYLWKKGGICEVKTGEIISSTSF